MPPYFGAGDEDEFWDFAYGSDNPFADEDPDPDPDTAGNPLNVNPPGAFNPTGPVPVPGSTQSPNPTGSQIPGQFSATPPQTPGQLGSSAPTLPPATTQPPSTPTTPQVPGQFGTAAPITGGSDYHTDPEKFGPASQAGPLYDRPSTASHPVLDQYLREQADKEYKQRSEGLGRVPVLGEKANKPYYLQQDDYNVEQNVLRRVEDMGYNRKDAARAITGAQDIRLSHQDVSNLRQYGTVVSELEKYAGSAEGKKYGVTLEEIDDGMLLSFMGGSEKGGYSIPISESERGIVQVGSKTIAPSTLIDKQNRIIGVKSPAQRVMEFVAQQSDVIAEHRVSGARGRAKNIYSKFFAKDPGMLYRQERGRVRNIEALRAEGSLVLEGIDPKGTVWNPTGQNIPGVVPHGPGWGKQGTGHTTLSVMGRTGQVLQNVGGRLQGFFPYTALDKLVKRQALGGKMDGDIFEAGKREKVQSHQTFEGQGREIGQVYNVLAIPNELRPEGTSVGRRDREIYMKGSKTIELGKHHRETIAAMVGDTGGMTQGDIRLAYQKALRSYVNIGASGKGNLRLYEGHEGLRVRRGWTGTFVGARDYNPETGKFQADIDYRGLSGEVNQAFKDVGVKGNEVIEGERFTIDQMLHGSNMDTSRVDKIVGDVKDPLAFAGGILQAMNQQQLRDVARSIDRGDNALEGQSVLTWLNRQIKAGRNTEGGPMLDDPTFYRAMQDEVLRQAQTTVDYKDYYSVEQASRIMQGEAYQQMAKEGRLISKRINAPSSDRHGQVFMQFKDLPVLNADVFARQKEDYFAKTEYNQEEMEELERSFPMIAREVRQATTNRRGVAAEWARAAMHNSDAGFADRLGDNPFENERLSELRENIEAQGMTLRSDNVMGEEEFLQRRSEAMLGVQGTIDELVEKGDWQGQTQFDKLDPRVKARMVMAQIAMGEGGDKQIMRTVPMPGGRTATVMTPSAKTLAASVQASDERRSLKSEITSAENVLMADFEHMTADERESLMNQYGEAITSSTRGQGFMRSLRGGQARIGLNVPAAGNMALEANEVSVNRATFGKLMGLRGRQLRKAWNLLESGKEEFYTHVTRRPTMTGGYIAKLTKAADQKDRGFFMNISQELTELMRGDSDSDPYQFIRASVMNAKGRVTQLFRPEQALSKEEIKRRIFAPGSGGEAQKRIDEIRGEYNPETGQYEGGSRGGVYAEDMIEKLNRKGGIATEETFEAAGLARSLSYRGMSTTYNTNRRRVSAMHSAGRMMGAEFGKAQQESSRGFFEKMFQMAIDFDDPSEAFTRLRSLTSGYNEATGNIFWQATKQGESGRAAHIGNANYEQELVSTLAQLQKDNSQLTDEEIMSQILPGALFENEETRNNLMYAWAKGTRGGKESDGGQRFLTELATAKKGLEGMAALSPTRIQSIIQNLHKREKQVAAIEERIAAGTPMERDERNLELSQDWLAKQPAAVRDAAEIMKSRLGATSKLEEGGNLHDVLLSMVSGDLLPTDVASINAIFERASNQPQALGYDRAAAHPSRQARPRRWAKSDEGKGRFIGRAGWQRPELRQAAIQLAEQQQVELDATDNLSIDAPVGGAPVDSGAQSVSPTAQRSTSVGAAAGGPAGSANEWSNREKYTMRQMMMETLASLQEGAYGYRSFDSEKAGIYTSSGKMRTAATLMGSFAEGDDRTSAMGKFLDSLKEYGDNIETLTKKQHNMNTAVLEGIEAYERSDKAVQRAKEKTYAASDADRPQMQKELEAAEKTLAESKARLGQYGITDANIERYKDISVHYRSAVDALKAEGGSFGGDDDGKGPSDFAMRLAGGDEGQAGALDRFGKNALGLASGGMAMWAMRRMYNLFSGPARRGLTEFEKASQVEMGEMISVGAGLDDLSGRAALTYRMGLQQQRNLEGFGEQYAKSFGGLRQAVPMDTKLGGFVGGVLGPMAGIAGAGSIIGGKLLASTSIGQMAGGAMGGLFAEGGALAGIGVGAGGGALLGLGAGALVAGAAAGIGYSAYAANAEEDQQRWLYARREGLSQEGNRTGGWGVFVQDVFGSQHRRERRQDYIDEFGVNAASLGPRGRGAAGVGARQEFGQFFRQQEAQYKEMLADTESEAQGFLASGTGFWDMSGRARSTVVQRLSDKAADEYGLSSEAATRMVGIGTRYGIDITKSPMAGQISDALQVGLNPEQFLETLQGLSTAKIGDLEAIGLSMLGPDSEVDFSPDAQRRTMAALQQGAAQRAMLQQKRGANLTQGQIQGVATDWGDRYNVFESGLAANIDAMMYANEVASPLISNQMNPALAGVMRQVEEGRTVQWGEAQTSGLMSMQGMISNFAGQGYNAQFGLTNMMNAFSSMGFTDKGDSVQMAQFQALLSGDPGVWKRLSKQAGFGESPIRSTQIFGHGTYGQQVYTDYMSGADAARLGTTGEIRAAMTGEEGGLWGLQTYQIEQNRGLQQRELGISWARLGMSKARTTGVGLAKYIGQYTDPATGEQRDYQGDWGYEDMSLGMAAEQRSWSRDFQDRQFAQQNQHFMDRWRIRANQLEEDTNDNSLQMQIRNVQREGYMQNFAFQQAKGDLQFGWQMEDMERAIRRSSGEERRGLMRQRDRASTMYGMDKEHAEDQLENTKRLWELQDQQTEKQKERAKEMLELDKQQHEERMALQQEQMLKYREWEDERLKMDEEKRDRDRKLTLEEFDLQAASLGIQQERIELNNEIADTERNISRDRMKMIGAEAEFLRDLLQWYVEGGKRPIPTWRDPLGGGGGAPKSSEAASNNQMKWEGGFVDEPRSFAGGGFTGNIGKYQKAGDVHGGEWVVPTEGSLVLRGENTETVKVLKDIYAAIMQLNKMGGGTVVLSTNNPQEASKMVNQVLSEVR